MNIDIGISITDRDQIATGLAEVLADSYTLYLKTQSFHWNVTGPMFQTLHTLFEQQYTELATAVDQLAERIRALGIYAPGSFSRFQAMSSIQEETGVPLANRMLEQLLEGHEAVIRTARKVLPVAQEAHDEATVDLLVNRMSVHEKTAWMLRSMLSESTVLLPVG